MVTEPVPTETLAKCETCGDQRHLPWQLVANWTRTHPHDCHKIMDLHAEVSRLTSALSTAEQERDYWKGRAEFAWEQGDADAAERISSFVEKSELRAELKRTREVVEAAKAYVAEREDLIRTLAMSDDVATGLRLKRAVDALRTDKEGADDH